MKRSRVGCKSRIAAPKVASQRLHECGFGARARLLAPMTSISGEKTNQKSIQQGKGAKKYE
jgi:hypothetical protein